MCAPLTDPVAGRPACCGGAAGPSCWEGRALPDARADRIPRLDRANLLEVRHERAARRYARCSTDQQDLTAQRDALLGLGVEAERIYVDHGLTGTNRERPGLREALAACRAGDTLVVTKLDRLARSLPDARAIADELTTRQISLSLGGSVYDPTDAVGRLLFNVLAMVAEFESDLIRLRTREGMKVAKAKGRLRGKQPQAEPETGSPPGLTGPQRRVQHPRSRRTVRSRPLHRLPRHRTATPRRQGRARRGDVDALRPPRRAGRPESNTQRDTDASPAPTRSASHAGFGMRTSGPGAGHVHSQLTVTRGAMTRLRAPRQAAPRAWTCLPEPTALEAERDDTGHRRQAEDNADLGLAVLEDDNRL
jgi:DNA invertase Pin-like site-specific DNA recombinase